MRIIRTGTTIAKVNLSLTAPWICMQEWCQNYSHS